MTARLVKYKNTKKWLLTVALCVNIPYCVGAQSRVPQFTTEHSMEPTAQCFNTQGGAQVTYSSGGKPINSIFLMRNKLEIGRNFFPLWNKMNLMTKAYKAYTVLLLYNVPSAKLTTGVHRAFYLSTETTLAITIWHLPLTCLHLVSLCKSKTISDRVVE